MGQRFIVVEELGDYERRCYGPFPTFKAAEGWAKGCKGRTTVEPLVKVTKHGEAVE